MIHWTFLPILDVARLQKSQVRMTKLLSRIRRVARRPAEHCELLLGGVAHPGQRAGAGRGGAGQGGLLAAGELGHRGGDQAGGHLAALDPGPALGPVVTPTC